ncbi:hypothetical protein [Allorhizobium borbori]|uniref:hypothetical protein n=1 Tax=Allorhizobium borbori TaxID=485907 RepID=UPI001F400EF7|nr:hypothetical protein [Allorhizobium borbori]
MPPADGAALLPGHAFHAHLPENPVAAENIEKIDGQKGVLIGGQRSVAKKVVQRMSHKQDGERMGQR